MSEINSRTYVVTGSESGMGRATRARLLNRGHRVIGVDIATSADVSVDLASADGRVAMVAEVDRLSDGVVDGVIACAGVGSAFPIATRVRLNYFGAVGTLEGLRPLLSRSVSPRAVTVGSFAMIMDRHDATVEACLLGDEDAAIAAASLSEQHCYASTKLALARWVRREAPTPEWAGQGINLNAVAPGIVRTAFNEHLLREPGAVDAMLSLVPMPLRGPGSPEDIAALLDWLTHPENMLVTGQVIFIDGGADVVVRKDDVW
jgi:NAD(P)-dependent dehydrogenase (short-subunit alcohol dehydrogenase family)